MSDILRIDDFYLSCVPGSGWRAEIVALVDDMVQTVPASRFGPAEFGAALCKGSIELEEGGRYTTADEQLELAEQVYQWDVITDL